MLTKSIIVVISLFLSLNCQATESYPIETEFVFGSIADKAIKLEIANNPRTRALGLMNRKELGQDQGMLFVFPKKEYLSFWMKNTLLPLSLGYFDANLSLLETHDMKPNQTEELYNSLQPAKYALEVNLGWFEKNKIPIGATLILERKVSARD